MALRHLRTLPADERGRTPNAGAVKLAEVLEDLNRRWPGRAADMIGAEVDIDASFVRRLARGDQRPCCFGIRDRFLHLRVGGRDYSIPLRAWDRPPSSTSHRNCA